MNGRRVKIDSGPFSLQPGEYGKHPGNGLWYARPPVEGDDLTGNLSAHTVVEHEDGTITVSPSILISARENGVDRELWHGYLERGVWRLA